MKDPQLKKIFILFLSGICVVCVAPYLITQRLQLISFLETGQIGDTIGGITAPITSLLGSVLVFFALKAQIEANKLVQEQFDQQRVDEIERKKILYLAEQVNLVRSDINDFSYTNKEVESSRSGDRQIYYLHLKGTDAIAEFLNSISYHGEAEHESESLFIRNPKFTELYNLLQIITLLLDKINGSSLPDEDLQYFKSSIAYQFNSKIKPPFVANDKHRLKYTEPCSRCGRRHTGIPDEIFELVDGISLKVA